MGMIYSKLKCMGNECIEMIYRKPKYTGMICYKPECFGNVCFKNVYFENEYSKLARSHKLFRTIVLQGGVLHVVVVWVLALQIVWRLKMASGVYFGILKVRLQEIC
jgi:hypothetical protein